ncbi:hypothetical protein [Algoriphagus ratkowskyi]|nr:hypothetical protein [Algoriphagus ratkowskyi]
MMRKIKNHVISAELLEKFKLFNTQFIQALIKLNEKSPEVALKIAKQGWYLGLISHMGAPLELNVFLENNQLKELDEWMMDEVKGRMEWIEQSLLKRNPERRLLFQEAFDNHRKGRYFSSIILLLSQVDGMCNERFGKSFFSIDRGTQKPVLKEPIEKIHLHDLNWMRIAFKSLTAINDKTSNSHKYPDFLNRHNILHGFDTKYGTEINSLKIISFLNCVNDMIYFDLEL